MPVRWSGTAVVLPGTGFDERGGADEAVAVTDGTTQAAAATMMAAARRARGVLMTRDLAYAAVLDGQTVKRSNGQTANGKNGEPYDLPHG